VENVYLLCSPCGLSPAESGWLTGSCRASGQTREELLAAFAHRFPHDDGLHKYRLECAQALLDAE
jgi:hypothetical protein